jgi:hypothetical protein
MNFRSLAPLTFLKGNQDFVKPLYFLFHIMVYGGLMNAAKCPSYEYEVEASRKEWTLKPKNKPKSPALKVVQFICPKCGKRFRTYKKEE